MKKAVLPNNISIAEINPHETKFLYNEIFVQKTYMRHGIEINPGDVIIDAGANIGMFALYALTHYNPARIYCFEPAAHCVEALRANLAAWDERVVILESALGDFEGEADFTYYPGYSIMSGLFADEDRDLDVLKAGARTQMARLSKFQVEERMIDALVGGKLKNAESFKCPVTTLSSVIEKYDLPVVNLLKIDVERAENAIIGGIGDRHWERIRQIVVEVHDQGAREHEAMRDALARRGFETTLDVEEGLENSAIYALTARRK
ncbi:MAG: FkbM family methyltransferase [Pseudomonadota bacterium]|nr:FkbM family methyltransferase [Pseudomonadota bacterium]